MDTQALEYLDKKYKEEIKVIEESLARGGAKDFAEYQHQCGIVRGLLTALREINDLLRKVKEYNDEL